MKKTIVFYLILLLLHNVVFAEDYTKLFLPIELSDEKELIILEEYPAQDWMFGVVHSDDLNIFRMYAFGSSGQTIYKWYQDNINRLIIKKECYFYDSPYDWNNCKMITSFFIIENQIIWEIKNGNRFQTEQLTPTGVREISGYSLLKEICDNYN